MASTSDPHDLTERLDRAAARLKAEHALLSGSDAFDVTPPEFIPAPDLPTALSLAEVKVRHARAQLSQLESRLGWDMRVRRAS